MGFSLRCTSRLAVAALIALLSGGCQVLAPGAARRLASARQAVIQHEAMIDFSGLREAALIPPLKAICPPPQNWDALPVNKTALYVHQQWRSPSICTGVGVCYIHLPLPLSAKTLVWFAKKEYTRHQDEGKLLDEWTDDLGRSWFEAENNKYHVRGYAMTHGFDAWIVYCGYKVTRPANAGEIGLAGRSAELILPDTSP